MIKVQVIGIGNVDRQDDGVGHIVADRLHKTYPNWYVTTVRQLLPEFVDSIVTSDLLVFVDGAVDLLPGTVVAGRVAGATRTLVSHQLSPAEFMALAGLVTATEIPVAWCVRIGIAELGFGQELSSDVQASVARAIKTIELLVESTVSRTSIDTPTLLCC